jgi:serine protease
MIKIFLLVRSLSITNKSILKQFYAVSLFLLISFAVFSQAPKLPEKPDYSFFRMPENIRPDEYLPQSIIVKFKPEYRDISKSFEGRSLLDKSLQKVQIISLEKKFPSEKPPVKRGGKQDEKLVDLSLIYEMVIDGDIEITINKLYRSGMVEYAEPYYLPKPLSIPDDTELNSQYGLQLIKAFDAWNITKGDTNIVIGIVDTGADLEHEDLKLNIKYNYNDPINGIDDDGDGYTDNFYGWNLGEGNNNPGAGNTLHGTHVAGIAAAVTNNSAGIAGVGYNTRFLPIKVSNANGQLVRAYEGIVYAANQGCQVINCSWGSTFRNSFGQDVINYATFNRNAVVVGGAGNNSNELKFFPAAFENCLGVAGSTSTDKKWSGSSFGYYVGISAPGHEIISSKPENSYGYSSGTSMASPCVAAAAALVISQFPHFTAVQVVEQLKVTADKIDQENHPSFEHKLGSGRLNILRALTETNHPSIVVKEKRIFGSRENYFLINDTVNISAIFKNYLAPSAGVNIKMEAVSPFVQVISGSFGVSSISSFQEVDNHPKPFRMVILKNAPINSEAILRFKIEYGAQVVYHYFTVTINVDYIHVKVNDIGTTITSTGKIGYNNMGQQDGLGFTFKDYTSLLFEGGLMIGTSADVVSSSVRGMPGKVNQDFQSILRVMRSPLAIGDYGTEGKLNDNLAEVPIGLSVNHNSFVWKDEGHRNYIILLYDLVNKSNQPIYNVHAGLFIDWDIDDPYYNKIDFDENNRLSYTWSTRDKELYAGIKILSYSNFYHYAIDNKELGEGGVDITKGFSTDKKFITLSQNRHRAGVNGDGNDVIDVMSAGPFNLEPGDTAYIAFALIAGESLDEIKKGASAAQRKYDFEIPLNRNPKPIDENEPWLGNCYPNPTKDFVTFELYVPEPSSVEFSLFNTIGQKVLSIYDDVAPEGLTRIRKDLGSLNAGVYYYRMTSGKFARTGKLTLFK